MTHQQDHSAKRTNSLRLSRLALGFVALAAIMGWGASFVGLHAYGMDQMVGFDYLSAWLIPATFDGAAFGATLITYRASIHGRSAVRGRLLMWTFTGISSWINWIHQVTPEARIVASGLPIAAVAVFDVVLAELRADYEERHGKRRLRVRPGLLLLRWLVDRRGTAEAFRKQVTDIPVSEIAGLGGVVTAVPGPAMADRVLEAGAEPPLAIAAAGSTRLQLTQGAAEPESPAVAVDDGPRPDPTEPETSAKSSAARRHDVPAEPEGAETPEAVARPEGKPSAPTSAAAVTPEPAVVGSTAPERDGTARQPVDVKQSIDGGAGHRPGDEEDLSMVQTVTIPVLPEGPLCPWPSNGTSTSENGRADESGSGDEESEERDAEQSETHAAAASR